MNYYLIAGVGFSEMRTVANKLVDKLSALHGAKSVIRQPFGALRYWVHNAETPSDGWKISDSLEGLGNFSQKLVNEMTDDTQHVVIHGPGVIQNLDKIITLFSSNDNSTPTKTKMTVGSTIKTYVIKTNENEVTMAERMQADWDKTEILNKGTGLVNPTAEEIQSAKDAYTNWASVYANIASTMFADYDDENFTPWGGWNDDGTPTSSGVGITDVNTITRKDGTTGSFTNHSHQLYYTEA
tara:strand:- start:1606 stop:2325 length:720 start_codon:yes stop_codon:yes gene_type:complete